VQAKGLAHKDEREETITKDKENPKLKTPLSQSAFQRFVMWILKHRCTPWTWETTNRYRKCTKCEREQVLDYIGGKPAPYVWMDIKDT
jgi:hypothetical protein